MRWLQQGDLNKKHFAKALHASAIRPRSAANLQRMRADWCGTAWPCKATAWW